MRKILLALSLTCAGCYGSIGATGIQWHWATGVQWRKKDFSPRKCPKCCKCDKKCSSACKCHDKGEKDGQG